ncbi:Centromere/kinetochore Zw10-domain-containing protein [Desarmillaria tabescens]|uniref:Centromere/kinetochore Zw10-domain-containing protein n=1 Tax=Armillaria tabescens TaxID=1929756 RepID=A0AA39NK61_ARMTA|nr:Centromere/kinetochore Zw10-domain-containing protein [Desarmillaria tabescens]KAK0466988.1 Centromere/kinetochore Zw10-domain-containing protein [Desarmillaria tabescens]
MAFPIPSHLPRRAPPQDVSSSILNKIDAATNESLNAALASSWIQELNDTIYATKKRIRERIHEDLPQFEQQLASAKSVQTRLQSLTSEVDSLSDKLSRPETGLIPTLMHSLTKHATLTQENAEANVLHDCLSHLLRCRTELESLDGLVNAGKLSDAVAACKEMEVLLTDVPLPLVQSNILVDLKNKFRSAKARTEDQLSEAYTRIISMSPESLIVRPSVQVRQSETMLDLSNVLSSLSEQALVNHLNILRRDLTTYYVDRILQEDISVTISSNEISCVHSSGENKIDSLSNVFSFLATHLFSSLPQPQQVQFPRSLCKPLSLSVLNNLLLPALPSSFKKLPPFLDLVRHAVEFEDKFIIGILGGDQHDNSIHNWADGVAGHYERRRRLQILDAARTLIMSLRNQYDVLTVEVELQTESRQPTVVPVQADDNPPAGDEDAWGFDDGKEETQAEGEVEGLESNGDGWGFDDELDAESDEGKRENGDNENDPGDAWNVSEETAWDDPWGDIPADEPAAPVPPTQTHEAADALAKAANKGKTSVNGNSPTSSRKTAATNVPHKPPEKRPPKLTLTETYLVSGQVMEILKIVEGVLNEGAELATSNIFPPSKSPKGNLLLQTAPSVVDLYKALYPVVFSGELKTALDAPLRFSNDCLYLSQELERIDAGAVKDRMQESQHRLEILGNSWLDDIIEQHRQSVDEIVRDGAVRFTFTGDQDRYDECEAALNKSKYYMAIGSVTEAALSRVLEDILALPDIPEVESRRLAELCRILHALEGLFVENPEQPSFVVAYAPSWLKYSYLSELLEASMADITYLFEEGALVDFEVDELVRLVRALFADTNLRTITVNKLLQGHPNRSDL